jgi:hypothetical protein
MSNTSINSLYDFMLQQTAAESYFEGIDLTTADGVRKRLILGANREGYINNPNPDLNGGYAGYTRMTDSQADEFLSKFQILHQWSDNPTPNGTRPAPKLGGQVFQISFSANCNLCLAPSALNSQVPFITSLRAATGVRRFIWVTRAVWRNWPRLGRPCAGLMRKFWPIAK